MKKWFLVLFFSVLLSPLFSQSVADDQLGAWYMYFVQKKFKDSRFGMQGDFQFRTWNGTNDLEQLLTRTGLTYKPKSADIMFTLGYAFIQTNDFGESTDYFRENRIYQEALLPQKLGTRVYLTHRWRSEQRWVENQDFRTRYRYNLFVNVPINKITLEQKAIYLAFYNEIFINGETQIGDGREVERFDRNRFYVALGYSWRYNFRTQFGWMEQTTANWSKGQLQFSMHHVF